MSDEAMVQWKLDLAGFSPILTWLEVYPLLAAAFMRSPLQEQPCARTLKVSYAALQQSIKCSSHTSLQHTAA